MEELTEACRKGDFEKVKSLVENKADITVSNNYAVRWASYFGHLDIVKFLFENKADLTARYNQALIWASENGHLDTVKFLVENKADITTLDNQPIWWASAHNHLETISYLLSQGADFSRLSKKHKSYFRSLKFFRRWRIAVFKRKLREAILYIHYSPTFSGGIKNKKQLENFLLNLN